MPSLHSPKGEVLSVDDEVQARELLSEFCRAQGYVVATAHDGRAALAAIARGPRQFGNIITDLQLPGVDGFEVLRTAREANPGVYVVMITGYASIDSAVRAVRWSPPIRRWWPLPALGRRWVTTDRRGRLPR